MRGARGELCLCGVCAACVTLEQVENARFARYVDPHYYLRRAIAWRSTLGGEVAVAVVNGRRSFPATD